MGGVGNESGRQEHGGKHLYDLFQFNLDTKRRTKLWEIKDDFPIGFVPCSNLILDDEKKYFYTLCYPQHQVHSSLQLYKFNMANATYEIVSAPIQVNAEQIETTVFLFYNKLMHEFYTVIREHANDGKVGVKIYSLSSPPVTFEQLEFHRKTSLYWLLLLLLLPAALGFWYFNRRKRHGVQHPEAAPIADANPAPEASQNENAEKEISRQNAVFVFGDFTVYDKNGKDISYRFSSKLRSLFALVLFYSTDNKRISTDMLTAELWPDKDADSAKNTRGVTINRLRGILSDISGITLFQENSKWYFSFEPSFYCDLIEYKKILQDQKEASSNENENMSRLLDILKRGVLLPSLQESWIDAYKHEYESEIYRIFWNYILKLNELKKYPRLVEFADLCLANDPLNEDVLRLSVNALQKTGKKDQAILLYNKFISNYKKSMGEDPDLSLF